MEKVQFSQRSLRGLLNGLKFSGKSKITNESRQAAKELISDPVVYFGAMELWLDKINRNLGEMIFEIEDENVLKAFDIKPFSRYHQPKSRDVEVFSDTTMAVYPATFAAVLIRFSLYGLDTHPEVFLEHLVPKIKEHKFITEDELTCLWHEKSKRKFEFLDVFGSDIQDFGPSNFENLIMPNKTKVCVQTSKDDPNTIYSITISR